MQTTKLRNGTEVLAKEDGSAQTWCNRTQAENAAAEIPGSRVYQPRLGPVFYVLPPKSGDRDDSRSLEAVR